MSKYSNPIDYTNMLQLTGANEDTRLLWRLGYFINANGCRRDFDLAITDMYLKGKMTDTGCEQLRKLVEGVDASILHGLVSPRLFELSILIYKINGTNF